MKFFRTWPVAALALGGLLILIGASVITTSRRAEEIYTQLDQLNSHHRDVESKLRRLRADVHLSGIYIRDYLLDTDRSRAPEYRERLTQLRQAHATTVKELRALSRPDATAAIDDLEQRLDDYWQAFEPLFDWTVVEKIMHSSRFLRREVLPRREAVLQITQEIEKLNNTNLAAQRAEVARRQAAFRDDLHRRLRRSLMVGFAIAFVAVLRLRWLEKRSDEQRVRSHLLSQQLVAAQEEERKKLTRELHDHVGQMLTALRMELGRAQRADPHANQVLAECKQLVDTILRSVRDLVMGLRPSMLDDFGLQPALEWHVRDFRRRANMRVELSISGDVAALPDQHRTCVYRIVQEALTNCARHAHAKRADISLRYESGRIELVVTDDGIGLDPTRSRGMGLLGIEERVRELCGTFEVRTPQQGGTQLSIVLPVPPADEEEVALARAAG
ncbi:MAG TPA: sensor histidine kinase [Thermoanaerobaculia bacterium]|jgi:signal transduction histidine kinase|nr:sensor histidine kinase [Thermoanaerobaculia bacterium]